MACPTRARAALGPLHRPAASLAEAETLDLDALTVELTSCGSSFALASYVQPGVCAAISSTTSGEITCSVCCLAQAP